MSKETTSALGHAREGAQPAGRVWTIVTSCNTEAKWLHDAFHCPDGRTTRSLYTRSVWDSIKLRNYPPCLMCRSILLGRLQEGSFLLPANSVSQLHNMMNETVQEGIQSNSAIIDPARCAGLCRPSSVVPFAGRFASSTGNPTTKSTITQHDERNSPGRDPIKLRNHRPCPMCRSVSTLLGRAVCRKVCLIYRQKISQYPNYQVHNHTT